LVIKKQAATSFPVDIRPYAECERSKYAEDPYCCEKTDLADLRIHRDRDLFLSDFSTGKRIRDHVRPLEIALILAGSQAVTDMYLVLRVLNNVYGCD
jgi:hypothetical protein